MRSLKAVFYAVGALGWTYTAANAVGFAMVACLICAAFCVIWAVIE